MVSRARGAWEVEQRVAISRGLNAWITPVGVGWVVLSVALDAPKMAVLSAIGTLGCAVAYLLNRIGHTTMSRHLSCTLTMIAIAGGCNIIDASGLVPMLLVALFAVGFVIFSWQVERRHLAIASAQPVLAYVVCWLADFSLLGADEVGPEQAERYVAPAAVFTTIATLSFVLLTLVVSIARYERRMTHALTVAERANRTQSTFFANMSHELRTPMNGVIGMSELLGGRDLAPEDRRHLNAITNSARSVLRIIDDILDVSKMEAGELTIEHVEVSLLDIAESVALEFTASAAEHRVALRLNVDPSIPAHVDTDPTRLRQIIRNLVSNAVRFSAREVGEPLGNVDVRVGWDEMSQQATVVVADDGIGMDEVALERLFVPFVQADQSTTRRFGGTGLGLSIVKTLVDTMHGTIEVDSCPERGTAFRVALPCRPLTAAAEPGIDLGDASVFGWFGEDAGREIAAVRDFVPGLDRMHVARDEAELGELVATADGRVLVVISVGSSSENDAVRDRLPEDGAQRCILSITADRSDHLGAVGEHEQVVARQPLLPSEFVEAVGELCAAAARADRAETSPVSVGAVHAGHVLVVEDNEVNQMVLRAQLERLGCTLEIAGDGAEGLERWTKGVYDLVLTDVQMPRMDGYELVAAIRATEAACGLTPTALIVITANAFESDRQRALDAGADACLSKPATLEQLRAAIDEVRRPSPLGVPQG